MHSNIKIIISLFRQVFNVSVSSAKQQIFVIACVFDVMQFHNMLQKYFNCSYHGSTSLPTRIIETFSSLVIYLLKVSNRNTARRCKICSYHVALLSLLLTLYIVLANSIEFEQANARWAEQMLLKQLFCKVAKLSLRSEILEKYLWRSSFLVKS